jgi:hypothetical protein
MWPHRRRSACRLIPIPKPCVASSILAGGTDRGSDRGARPYSCQPVVRVKGHVVLTGAVRRTACQHVVRDKGHVVLTRELGVTHAVESCRGTTAQVNSV